MRAAQYQEGLQVANAEESRLRDIVEDWRRMPDVPDRRDIDEALQPQPYLANPEPLCPDMNREERELRNEIRREVVAQYAKTPLYVAIVLLVAGLALTGQTQEGAFGGLAIIGFVLYVPVWGIRRYLRISRQARAQADAKWAETERCLRAGHEAAINDHHEREAETKRNWEQLEVGRIAATHQLLAGNRDAVDAAVEAALEALDFPFAAVCAASVLTRDTVVVAVDLPEIESVIPETRLKALKNGTVKQVRRTKRERNDAWRHLALGVALQIGRTIVAVAPSIQNVRVAGYTQRRQRSGIIADEWVYDFGGDRRFLSSLSPETVDPFAISTLPDVRIMLGSSGELKRIPPPAWLEELVAV